MQDSASSHDPKVKAPSWPIRRQMLALVAACTIPLIGLTAFSIYADFCHDGVLAGHQALRLAGTTAGYVSEHLHGNRVVLDRFAEEPLVRALDPARCSPQLRSFLDFHPDVAEVATLDAHGRVVCSGAPPGSRRSIHALGEERLAQLFGPDAPSGSRVIAPVGAARLSMQVRALTDDGDDGGRRTGFVVLLVNVAEYLPAPEFTAQEPGMTYDVLDGAGRVVSHLPDTGRWRRDGLLGSPLVRFVLGRPEGQLRARGGDGVERLYGFMTIAGADWRVVVGFPAQDVDAPAMDIARRHAAIAFVIVLVVVFVTFALGRRITQPIAQIAEAAKAAADGRPTRAPTQGAAEIVEVARQFNHMIEVREETDAVLKVAMERLQVLSRRLIDVQETERRHVARELHDEIGQALTAVKIHLRAQQRTSGGAPQMDACVAIVERALTQVRGLCLDLRPPLLDDLGLAPALRWQLDTVATPAGLNARFSCNLDQAARLHPDLEIVCFRVAQEALTNVVRHARAREVSVRLESGAGNLLLAIRDDGVGFDPQDAGRRGLQGKSMGLLSMGERVSLLGGRLELDSAPGCGTEVRVCLSLHMAPVVMPLECSARSMKEVSHEPDACLAG